MKNSWNIFRADWRRLTASVVAVVVMLGLCLVPCLYAWFNILSNWDPYGPASTGNIKVAVANEDEGREILGLHLNIGELVMDGLQTNDQMGWVFLEDRDTALDGVYAGEYYAALIVPEDFTSDFVSLLDGDLEHPQIQYFENEKKNAIAPKITGKAKTAVQEQINNTIIEKVADALTTASSICKALGLDGEDVANRLIEKLQDAQWQMNQLSKILTSLENVMDNADDLLTASAITVDDVNGVLVSASNTVGGIGDMVNTGSDTADGASNDVIAILDTIDKGLVDLENKLRQWGTSEDPTLLQQQIIQQINDAISRLEELKDKAPDLADKIDAAIEKLEKEWTEYPVLHFDLSGGKHMGKDQLERYLGFILEMEEKKWGITQPQIDANNRLTELIYTAYEKTGKQVVVLIDEYDAPMLDVAHEQEQLDALRNIMRNFFSPLKFCEAKLRFVFLTGITKFSQVSIFSELNNITLISMDKDYAGICGITQEELLTQMQEDIDMLAQSQDLTREATIAKLKEHYDGYHFAKVSPDVFNPYSLLNCFAEKEFGAYWFSSGTPTYLINMLNKFEVLPNEIAPTEALESAFDAPTEKMKTITPLLYQSGYVTIKNYDKDTQLYTLDIPNKEIRVGLFDNLLPNYVDGKNAQQGGVTIAKMASLIRKQDMDGALQLLQDYFETIPYCHVTNHEGHYQQMLYIIFTLLTGFVLDVEVHTPRGRVDMVLLTQTDLYLIELKLNKSAQAAMRQMNLKNYHKRFALCGKPITKVGINFDSATGSIKDWIIEKA